MSASSDAEALREVLCNTDSSVVRDWLLAQPAFTVPELAKVCGEAELAARPEDARARFRLEVRPLVEGHVGNVGDVTRVFVWFARDGEGEGCPPRAHAFVMKGLSKERLHISLLHGLTREADFYSTLVAGSTEGEAAVDGRVRGVCVEAVRALVPTVYAAQCEPVSGAKRTLMCDLSVGAIESGTLVGAKHTPLNASKDTDKIVAEAYARVPDAPAPPTEDEVIARAYLTAAHLHARHWNVKALLDNKWLRNADLYSAALSGGAAPARYAPTCMYLRDRWREQVKPTLVQQVREADGAAVWVSSTDGGVWSQRLVDLVDLAVSDERLSWDYFAKHLARRPFTVTHGDFHPGNMMWQIEKKDLVLFDFEMVGLGFGPQDPAQFIISHVHPSKFGALAETCLPAYYEIVKSVCGEYSFEDCLRDYIDGGLGKWLWFLIILALDYPKLMGHFLSQTDAFAATHNMTADNWTGCLSI